MMLAAGKKKVRGSLKSVDSILRVDRKQEIDTHYIF